MLYNKKLCYIAHPNLPDESIPSSSVGLASTAEGPQPIRSHPSAWPAPPTVRGPSTVIIQSHRMQPEPPTRSQASSNLNFKFTYHASENSSHPILLGHSWRPSLSSRPPLAWPAPPTVRGPSTQAIEYSLSIRLGVRHHPARISSSPIMHRKTVVIQFCRARVTVDGPVYPPSKSSRHLSAWPASPTVRGPSTVIIPGHRIQPEPPTRSQASSNLNFKFTFHPSELA